MINEERFEQILDDNPIVRDALQKSTVGLYSENSLATASLGKDFRKWAITSIIAYFLFTQIGLPYLVTLRNTTDLIRNRIEQKIDEQYQDWQMNPEEARKAAREVREEVKDDVAIQKFLEQWIEAMLADD